MPAQKRERPTVGEALRQRRAKHLKRLKRFKEAQAKAKAEANDIVKRQLAYKYDEVNEDLATPARRTDRAISGTSWHRRSGRRSRRRSATTTRPTRARRRLSQARGRTR